MDIYSVILSGTNENFISKSLSEFTDIFKSNESDRIIPFDFALNNEPLPFMSHKCCHILTTGKNAGCQCKLNKKLGLNNGFFCTKHDNPNIKSMFDTPLFKKLFDLSKTEQSSLIKDKSDDLHIKVDKCCAILNSGVNKGKQCICNRKENSYFCGKHKKFHEELNKSYPDLSFEDKFTKTPICILKAQ